MTKKNDHIGIMLAAVNGASLLAAMAVRAFFPRIIIPKLDGPAIVLLSLAALVADFYISRNGNRFLPTVPVYGALVFGIFPWAASFLPPTEALKTAVLGAVIFTVTTLIFDTATDRLSSGPAAKAAPVISALGLYLAAQCLMGIV